MADVIVLVVVCSVLCLIHSITHLPFLLNFLISFFFSALLTYCSIVNKTFLPLEGVIEYFKSSANNVDNSRKETAEVDEVDERNRYDDEITKKFREINKNIIRDFILDWYHAVSNDVEFVQEAFELFEYFFTQLRDRVSKVDTDVVVRVLLQRLVRHHKCYKEANKIARQQDDPAGEDHHRHRQEEKLLAAYETLNGHLAMSSLPDTETDHHRSLVVIILKGLLPTSYKLVGTSLYLVRELIARNCVLNVVDMMAEPMWMNNMIYLLLSAGDEEVGEENDVDTTTTTTTDEQAASAEPAQESAAADDDDDDGGESSTAGDDGNMYKAVTYSKSCHLIDEDDDDGDMVVISSADVIISDDNHVELVMGKSESESALSSHLVHDHQLSNLNSMLRFQQLRIPEAIEAYEVHDPSKKYTLYKIAYVTTTTTPNHDDDDDDDDDVAKDHQMEKYEKTYQVSRRFREFINLHERLSDKSPQIRKALKNVRPPSRGFPMGIGNMEKDYIEKRRFFLQAYLRHLCYIPVVALQPELGEFLAFESDPRIAFVGKPTEFIPRFDKMLKNAVSEFRGFFHTTNNQQPASLTATQHTTAATNEQQQQPEVVQKLRQIVLGTRHSTRANHFNLGTRTFAPLDSNTPVSRDNWVDCDTLLRRVAMTSSLGEEVTTSQQHDYDVMLGHRGHGSSEDNEIAAFLCQLLGDVWSMKLGQQTFTFLAVGRYMNQFVQEKVKTLTQAKEWVIYLQKLQNVLWPGGKWCTKQDEVEEDTKTREQVLDDARDVVREFIPDIIEQIVGETRYNKGVDDLLESFQHPTINRHLIYHIFDSCLDLIFPDLHSIVQNRHNINL